MFTQFYVLQQNAIPQQAQAQPLDSSAILVTLCTKNQISIQKSAFELGRIYLTAIYGS